MLRLKGIRNIVFDFGGVLVDLKPEACLEAFDRLGMERVREYLTPYGHKGPFGLLEEGKIDLPTFRDQLRALFQVKVSDEALDAAWAAFLLDIPVNKMRMVHALAKHYRVFLLSNTNAIHIQKLQQFETRGFPLSECFERLFLSYEMGLSKPGKGIFERMMQDADMIPEETLLVDDAPANCQTAASLGMQTYQPRPFEDFTSEFSTKEPCVLTLGFFDGVHKGHQYLIEEAVREGRARNLPVKVLSFWPHPRTILHSDFYPQLLTSLEEKEALLRKQGVDAVHTLTFDQELAAMSAEVFMREVLRDELNVACLVIGFDHRFGASRSDGFEDYVRYGKSLAMDVRRARPLIHPNDGETPISSSLIRRALLAGDMERASHGLGRYYELPGVVVQGKRIGRTIGFPTANIEPLDPNKLLPMTGVYAVWVRLDSGMYKGMLNIGRRPTLQDESDLNLEVHLLNYEGDLYGRILRLQFVSRFRSEMHFPDVDALVKQLQKDKCFVDDFLKRL